MGMLEVFDCRGKKDKKGNYPGLYLDDVTTVWTSKFDGEFC